MSQCEQYDRVITNECREGATAKGNRSHGETVIVVATGANHYHLTDCLADQGYTVETVAADEVIEIGGDSDAHRAALIDADGCSERTWDCCTALKKNGLPVVVLGNRLGGRRRARALTCGAQVALEKPVRKAELLGILEAL